MRIAGVILIVLGGLSTLGAILNAAQGKEAGGAGLGFVVLGFYLISRSNKKKEEEKKKKQWEEKE